MAAIVNIVSRRGLGIEACFRINLITVSFHCISCTFHFKGYLKQLCISNKIEYSVIRIGVVRCESRSMKEEGYTQTVSSY